LFDNNTDIDILASYEEGNNLAYYYVIESGVERYSAFSDVDVLLGYLSSYYIIIVLPIIAAIIFLIPKMHKKWKKEK
jgi:hypothetical protein